MDFTDSCMSLSSVFELLTYIQQVKYNKYKKSVYGLSYDYVLLSWISYLASVISSMNYYINPQVIKQYRKRFPVHSEVVISFPIFVIDLIGVIVVSGLLVQLFVIYPRTKNVNQGVSSLNKLFIFFILVVLIWMSKCCLMSQRSLFLLDIIDYIWLISKVTSIFKLVPQLSMNWFSLCVVGLNHSFLVCQWVSVVLLTIGKNSLIWTEWYDIPINYNTWCYLIIYTSSLVVLSIQQKIIYYGLKPSLELDYLEHENTV